MAKVELTPLRSWDDFFPGLGRFAKPDDWTKWNNRVASNLLYYQTNYLTLAVTVLLLVGFLDPLGMLTAGTVVSGVFIGSVWVGENNAVIRDFKTQNPTVFVFGVMVASWMLIFILGKVMIFMNAMVLPLALILAHASYRLRNMKNKLENKIESVGWKRSPMGLLLQSLGQEIQNFLDGKQKE